MGFNDCAGGIIFSSRMSVDFKIRRVVWFFPVSNGEKMSFKVVAIRLVSPGVLFEKINRNRFQKIVFQMTLALKFLIAPDKFKGSLSARAAAEAMAAGVLRVHPDADLDICPIADGGEGFMETLAPGLDARWITCAAVDALGRPIESRYLLAETPQGLTAILEMAETAGLWRLTANERNPAQTTTRGTGMQMVHAAQNDGVVRIILGLGGSATHDGGAGMAAALGHLFIDENGVNDDPRASNLGEIRAIDFGRRVDLPEIIAACDVDNPLLGARGATAVFSGQKGASVLDQPSLENALAHLVAVSEGHSAADIPGAGAAGGLGFGLLHFAGASLVSGFDLISSLLGLEARIAAADHVLTGEGSLDYQSLSGKGPVGLARLAQTLGIPVTAFCGVADDEARGSVLFHALHALTDSGLPLDRLIAEASPLLTDAVANAKFFKP
jgi:glycerate kinase